MLFLLTCEVSVMPLTSAKTKYEHVVLDEKGIPIIAGTNASCCPAEIHWQVKDVK
jgi:hypothetical protein